MMQRHLDWNRPGNKTLLRWLWTILPAALLAAGCGSPGAPAPPSLNLATPVANLTAARSVDAVLLNWTMPAKTTDGVVFKKPIPVQICRALADQPCTVIATVSSAPNKLATYTDHLPAALTAGPEQLLTYTVVQRNHAQKTAGPSNPAFSAAGAAPPALTGLTAQVRPDGVLLSWHAAAETTVPGQAPARQIAVDFHILRTLQSPPPPSNGLAPAVPLDQTLVVHAGTGADPGHALDKDAALNQRYRYTVRRVAVATIAGHSVEVEGQPGEPLLLATTDIFPPPIPQGLAAVADAATGGIDLSWLPVSDQDLAGYAVYRRDLASGLPAQRVSPATPSQAPAITPAFHDAGLEPGHTYGYSVSAVSQGGYESQRSPEVVETLPNK
jgi:hypothetical protein